MSEPDAIPDQPFHIVSALTILEMLREVANGASPTDVYLDYFGDTEEEE